MRSEMTEPLKLRRNPLNMDSLLVTFSPDSPSPGLPSSEWQFHANMQPMWLAIEQLQSRPAVSPARFPAKIGQGPKARSRHSSRFGLNRSLK